MTRTGFDSVESSPPVSLKIRWAHTTGKPGKATSTSLGLHRNDQRQRRTHHKVRTGCLTCKARRKKCDEAKPACQRCTTTGRTCEGYTELSFSESTSDGSPSSTSRGQDEESNSTPTSIMSTAAISLSTTSESQLCRAPNYFAAVGPVSDLDCQSFSYFLYCTFPQFSAYFDSPLQRSNMMRAMHNPALFSAAVALATVHRRFSYGISREAFELCAHADRLHKKAIRDLAIWKRQNFGRRDSFYHQTTAMIETVLSTFELFQDQREASIEHTKQSTQHLLLSGSLRRLRKERRYCRQICHSRAFAKLLYQVYCQISELFDSPISILAKVAHGRSLPPMPHRFSSLEQARDFLFTEIDWIILSPARWQDSDDRHVAHNLHAARFADWGHAYANLIPDLSRTPRQERACAFLKLARNAIYLLSFAILFIDNTTHDPVPISPFPPDSDDFVEPKVANMTTLLWQASKASHELGPDLANIKVMLEPLVDDPTVWNLSNIDFDGDYIPDVQHQSATPSSYHCKPPQTGVYAVSNRISSDHEDALAAALRGVLPMFNEPGGTDVSFMWEDGFMLIRYYETCDDGVGYWFTQEWWKI